MHLAAYGLVVALTGGLVAVAQAPYAVVLALAVGGAGVWMVRAGISPHPPLVLVPISFVVPTPFLVELSGRTMPVQWAEVLLGLALAAWIPTRRLPPGRWVLPLVVGLGWVVLTLVAATDMLRALTGLKVAAEVTVLALLAASPPVGRLAPTSPVHAVVWMSRSALAAGAVYTLLLIRQGALANFRLGWGEVDEAAVAATHNSLTIVTLAVGRANYLGALMLLGVIAALATWRWLGGVERVVTFWAIALTSVGIVATGSKAQLIAYVVVVALAPVLSEAFRRSLRERVLAGSCLAYGVFIALSWPYLAAVLSTLRVEPPRTVGQSAPAGIEVSAYIAPEGTTGRRLEIWSSALSEIRDHPILGSGPANVRLGASTGTFPTAHNLVLHLAVESGIPGLLIYAWPLVVLAIRATGAVRRAVVLIVAGLLVSGAGEPTLRTGPYDLVAWAILGVWAGLVLGTRGTSDENTRGGEHARASIA